MLTTTMLQTLPAARSTSRRPGWEIIAVALAAAIAHLPLLIRHAAWLWQRPHYQFFPFVMIGAALLAYTRMRIPLVWRPGSAVIVTIGLSISWLLLASADFLFSPWLSCISFMILLLTIAYAIGGRELCRQALPAWILLWLLVPPPMDLDQLLMFKLQNLTSLWSCSVLDAFGVYHVRNGNVIDVDGRKLMVEQACSGINSLYSMLACTLFWIFLAKRGWVHGTLLLASAVGWVISANIARVIGVVLIETHWGINVSTGFRHEAFGAFMFAVAVGLLYCTDNFFSFLIRSAPVIPGGARPTQASTSFAAIFESPTKGMRRVALALIPAYLLLAVGYWAIDKQRLVVGLEEARLPAPEKGLLPPRIGSWEQTDFATQNREANSYYGERSCTWSYSRARREAIVSLDYPFPSWHDLTWCYSGNGWAIDSQDVRNDLGIPGGCLQVRMSQANHRQAHLLFCEFDSNGQPLAARPGGTGVSLFRHQRTMDQIRNRLGFQKETTVDPNGPIYQLQVFLECYDKLSNEDELAHVELFIRAEVSFRDFFAAQK